VNDTTKAHIRGVIQSGLESGKTLTEIGKDLQKRALPMSNYRAHVIARTETHTTANAGIQLQAETSDFETKKEWLAVNDDRTRDDHSGVDGDIVDLGEAFSVGGEDLMYPGEPTGSASNVIACRCAVGHIII
jgi:SPP1 gp7 family putative phage head morphogenesis protein